MRLNEKWILIVLGILLIVPYFLAYRLGNLRLNTAAFEYIFFNAYVLYALACLVVIQDAPPRLLFWIFSLVAVSQMILTLTRPTLSDDMFRYVWDGRVQAHGISPYRYPPSAPELAALRDKDIYPHINRKPAVTVYPPAAEAAYALLWRIVPDNVRWFQIAMSLGGISAGLLLAGLLRDLGRPASRALIYLWSPLLAFETAHAAHVDGLVLPFLVGAWWARVREHAGLVGILLGVATAMKFYPALLLPFLWQPGHPRARWQMPLAFLATMAAFYLPYTIASGSAVLGFLPNYFQESFNVSPLVSSLKTLTFTYGWNSPNRMSLIALGVVILLSGWAILKPAPDAETALRRCMLPIGTVTLLSQNLFSWYMLWLLPLIAIFLEPSSKKFGALTLPGLDAWTGWWLFCGLVGFSYTFFLAWKPMPAAIYAQFLPLYAILIFGAVRKYVWR